MFGLMVGVTRPWWADMLGGLEVAQSLMGVVCRLPVQQELCQSISQENYSGKCRNDGQSGSRASGRGPPPDLRPKCRPAVQDQGVCKVNNPPNVLFEGEPGGSQGPLEIHTNLPTKPESDALLFTSGSSGSKNEFQTYSHQPTSPPGASN
jgi:hypothetical protein